MKRIEELREELKTINSQIREIKRQIQDSFDDEEIEVKEEKLEELYILQEEIQEEIVNLEIEEMMPW